MDEIGRTHARILAALWALEGAAWLEVQGEVHEDYKEMPFWILLAADVPPIEAHPRMARPDDRLRRDPPPWLNPQRRITLR